MTESVRLSGAESPLPRWGRRVLLVAAAGAGIWLLGCLNQHTAAQAATAWPKPVAPTSSASVKSLLRPPHSEIPGIPVPGAARLAGDPIPGVARLPAGPTAGDAVVGGSIRAVPAVPLPPLVVSSARHLRPVVTLPVPPPAGQALPPPVHRTRPGAASAASRLVADIVMAGGCEPVAPPAGTAEQLSGRAPGDSAPHPRPLPAPGIPMSPAGEAGEAPGAPHSLPLGEPAARPMPGWFAGRAEAWSVTASGLRQRACLPDTPPG